MSASAAKRCFLRSLNYWSRKTLESNKSVRGFRSNVYVDLIQYTKGSDVVSPNFSSTTL